MPNLQRKRAIGEAVQSTQTLWGDVGVAICQAEGDSWLRHSIWIGLDLGYGFDLEASALQVSALLLRSHSCIKMDGRGDNVDMLSNASGNAVVIAGKMIISSVGVGIN